MRYCVCLGFVSHDLCLVVGQTLLRVLVDSMVPSFSHGHTYVALSRTPTRQAFHMWVSEDTAQHGDAPLTNVVYEDLLLPDNYSQMWNIVTEDDYMLEEEGYSSDNDSIMQGDI